MGDTELKNREGSVWAPFFVRGELVGVGSSVHRSRDLGVDFLTPEIDLDKLAQPRSEPPPLLNAKLSEIIDFLAVTGQKLLDPRNVHIQSGIEQEHPIVKSMSAVYWRGGDERIEPALFRPQYFDKIVAWGGGDAIHNVIKYLGPGIQLISFDPTTSISMIGREVFASDETLEEAADLAAADVMVLNQEACVSSRFIFLEAVPEQASRFSERLNAHIFERARATGDARPLDMDLREQIEVLRMRMDVLTQT